MIQLLLNRILVFEALIKISHEKMNFRKNY